MQHNWSNAQSVDFNFTTINNIFCSPQTVTFTQNCSGTPEAFFWDFGNGQTGNGATQNIQYFISGNYTISLTAVYATGTISSTKTITINATPSVTLSSNTNYICQPGNIIFTATASANTISYNWDFGDGSSIVSSTNNSITHNFTTYNNFTIKVTAITATGCIAIANTTIEVKKMPISGIAFNTSGCIPANTIFTATPTLPQGDAPASFLWNYGNGSTAATTVNNSTFLYNNTNVITTANVTITSTQGCVHTFNFPTLAYGTPPYNTIASTALNKDTFCGSETIIFKAIAINGVNYNWNFGDGTTITTTDTITQHRYTTLGNKTIIVTPSYNGCNGFPDTLQINIKGVFAKYTFSNTCNNKNTFQFINTSLGNISKFYWNFNNSTMDSVVNNPSYTYASNGIFTTSLIVIDYVTGCKDTLNLNQYTATPSLQSSAIKICKGSPINYNVLNPYSASSNYNYTFNMAGISYNNGPNAIVQTNPVNFGNFNDFVIISNPLGNTCNDTVYLNNTTIVAGPNVQFNTSNLTLCKDQNFLFTNNSYPFINTDTIIKYYWQYGDNTVDSIKQPLPKNYANSGNYTVTLTALDVNNCIQTFSVLVQALPIPYLKAFPISDTICKGQTLLISAYTNDTLTWQPLTGLSCATCDTTYVSPLTTTNYVANAKNSFGCMINDTVVVHVVTPLKLNIQPNDTSICPKQFVQFNSNTKAVYNWQPSTFLSATNITNPSAVVDSSIVYTVIGTDSIGCFSDTALVKINTYTPATVNAGNDTIVPYNTAFTLLPTLSNNITTIAWSPLNNNLNCAFCANPSGIALISTMYYINVTSNNGCIANDSVKITVNCSADNLFIPTAFTPNNDGLNDYFYPVGRGYKIINSFVIYNRWGQKIFEKNNFLPNNWQLGWDGFYKGQKITEYTRFSMVYKCNLRF